MTFFRSEARRLGRTLIVIVLAAFFAVSCGGSKSPTAERNNRNQPVPQSEIFTVTTAQAAVREVPAYISATGSLTATETSGIAPKTAGKVTDVGVKAGDFVVRGAVIAKLDVRDAQLRLAQANAGVAQTVAAVRQAEARLGLSANGGFSASVIPEVRAADAVYEQAFAELRQAEANEKRYRELVETGDVSMQNYENYRTLRDTARARVNNTRQQSEAARNAARQNNEAIKSAEAAVNAARTQIDSAKQGLADTIIRAPFTGYISSRPVAVGEFVSTATVVATLLQTNPIKVQLQVAEVNVPLIVLGRGVSIAVESYQNRRFAGTVTSVNPAIDPATRTAIIEASIENGDNALRSGMFATAQIAKPGGGTGIFVPRAAVYNDQNTQSSRVFVIQEGVAQLRVVQIGTEENDSIRILSGVNAGETVATGVLDKLYEGARVQ